MNKGKPSHTLFELNLRPIKYTLFLDRVYLFSLFVVVVSFFVLVFIVDFFVSFRYSQHIIHSIYAENTLCKCMVGLFLIFNRCGVLTGKIYLKPYFKSLMLSDLFSLYPNIHCHKQYIIHVFTSVCGTVQA